MANDFLPFGGDGAANVMSQADYVALAARLTGFQSGVAQSAQLNKVWRQSSIIAAVLAQFIVDLSGQDAVDDGTLTTLLTNLKSAVSAQSVGVIGTMRNARMSVTAASATATFTADEIVVENTLGGKTYRLPSFNKTINLATTGAGGMDVGAAPNSGFVAVYAIYNPTTGASALLAKNATSAAQPEVYAGANMPDGYAASALVSVWPTTAGGLLDVAAQLDRDVFTAIKNLYTGAGSVSLTLLSLSTTVPLNARVLFASAGVTPSASGNIATVLCSTSSGVSAPGYTAFQGAGTNLQQMGYPLRDVPLLTPQTVWFATAGTGTFNYNGLGYRF